MERVVRVLYERETEVRFAAREREVRFASLREREKESCAAQRSLYFAHMFIGGALERAHPGDSERFGAATSALGSVGQPPEAESAGCCYNILGSTPGVVYER